jgi:hypothetical protein
MEIRDQCMMARVAFANLKNGINSFDRYLCWSLVQTILASLANISKIFWPAYDKDKAEKSEEYSLRAKQYSLRGTYLRQLLLIDKRSPLNSRTLRSYFEHYDERLQDWAEKSKNLVLINRNIISEGSMNVSNGDIPTPAAHMGTLEPTTFILTFWNDSIEIPVLMKSIEELLETIEKKVVEQSFPADNDNMSIHK